jgi:DNA invertase Pin-like site-specific DNA recombinase
MKKYTAHYNLITEQLMLSFYKSLNEKDRRHYAAIEADKLGHGGINYIAELFGCTRQTIYSGLNELKKKSTSTDRADPQ